MLAAVAIYAIHNNTTLGAITAAHDLLQGQILPSSEILQTAQHYTKSKMSGPDSSNSLEQLLF